MGWHVSGVDYRDFGREEEGCEGWSRIMIVGDILVIAVRGVMIQSLVSDVVQRS